MIKYFFSFVLIVACVGAVNFFILWFLKRNLSHGKERKEKEIDFDSINFDFGQELNELREIIEENIEEARKEKFSLENTKEEIKCLLKESRECIRQLEQLNIKKDFSVGEDTSGLKNSREKETKDVPSERIGFLLSKGYSVGDIAQRLQMGVGEARLRIAFLEKERARWEACQK